MSAASRAPSAIAVLAVALLALSGCSGSDSEAGFGLPTLEGDEATAALSSASVDAERMTGALTVESNGCFTWTSDDEADGAWIVWPDGAQQDGARVVLGGGPRVDDGTLLNATAAVVSLDDLPDGAVADSYFGSFGGFCDAGERGVLVLLAVSSD